LVDEHSAKRGVEHQLDSNAHGPAKAEGGEQHACESKLLMQHVRQAIVGAEQREERHCTSAQEKSVVILQACVSVVETKTTVVAARWHRTANFCKPYGGTQQRHHVGSLLAYSNMLWHNTSPRAWPDKRVG
jgi:hypothetical protein